MGSCCHCHLCVWIQSFQPAAKDPKKRPLSFKDFWSTLITKIEQFTTDGAADEVLCGELLEKDLPNLKLRCKDSAHASRRWGNEKEQFFCLFSPCFDLSV